MGNIATTIVPTGRMMLRYADMLVGGVTPETFGRKPQGIDTNTPAFCYGHLALYPEFILEAVGRQDLMIDTDGYRELFGAGKECRDDPDGSAYPAMDSILERFRARHGVVMDALPEVTDETMLGANPRERAREFLPTVGAAVAFYLGGHAFTHLGQVSAWRRAMGLKSVM